jgi:hypothetical protein
MMPVLGWVRPIGGHDCKISVLISLAVIVVSGGCADHERKTRDLKMVTVHIEGFKKSESGAT